MHESGIDGNGHDLAMMMRVDIARHLSFEESSEKVLLNFGEIFRPELKKAWDMAHHLTSKDLQELGLIIPQ